MTRHIRLFLLALGFLTRLAPPLQAEDKEMSDAARYYPLTGLALGLLQISPSAFGLFQSSPAVQAWLYVLIGAWLTRALHLDGLADVLDALGSGKTGGGFRAVLKDSRMGAFGAAGLVLALAGQLIFAHTLLAAGSLAPLLFAPIYARSLPLLLVCTAPPYGQGGLGSLMTAAKTPANMIISPGTALACGLLLLPLKTLLLCLALTAPLLLWLARTAKQHGGYNGDFFGFFIVAGELVVLLAALA